MAEEVVSVDGDAVACEGNGPVTGHPRVYLTFKPGETRLVCPYCSRVFVRQGTTAPAVGGH